MLVSHMLGEGARQKKKGARENRKKIDGAGGPEPRLLIGLQRTKGGTPKESFH